LWGVAGRLSPPGGRDPLGAGTAQPEHLAVRRLWPDPYSKVLSTPPALLRQSTRLSAERNRPVARPRCALSHLEQARE
jgi:hypothetical protein